jgi:hypothetical protein
LRWRRWLLSCFIAGYLVLVAGAGIFRGSDRWLLALYNLPLAIAFLSLLVALFHLRRAAGQRLHISLVSGEEWRKVREQYRQIRHHEASDEDLTVRFLPSLLDASEQNAEINERERAYSRGAMLYGIYSLALVIIQVLLQYAMGIIAVAGGFTRFI